MANLFDGVIDTDGEYKDIETEGEFSFVSGDMYTIQVKSGVCDISKSEEGGVNVGGGREFNFTADGDPVYIKTNGKVSLSIL